MRLLGVLGLVAAAAAAEAATWTCSEQVAELQQKTYFVASRCSASGSYTTGGDPVGDGTPQGTAAALCASAQRHVRGVMVSNTSNAAGAFTFVGAWDQTTLKITLATASDTPTPGTSLAQVAAGTSINGYTIRVLAFCN